MQRLLFCISLSCFILPDVVAHPPVFLPQIHINTHISITIAGSQQLKVLAARNGVLLTFSSRRSTARLKDGSLKWTALEPGPRGTDQWQWAERGEKTPNKPLQHPQQYLLLKAHVHEKSSLGDKGNFIGRKQSNLYHELPASIPTTQTDTAHVTSNSALEPKLDLPQWNQ